jgi:hypothetical protein
MSERVLRSLLTLAVMAALAAVAPQLAVADVFGPASLASISQVKGAANNQQMLYAHDSAISGDGRYVVFDGSYDGFTGVWRRDLSTGAIEPVATANPGDPAISAPDAQLPSISDDGQYVSFTTTARLDPIDDTNKSPDVYVRNMDRAAGEEGAYSVASAVDGGSAALTYEGFTSTGESREIEEGWYGAVAAGRSAISADGSKVAFVTTATSNLAGAATPAMQVAVRDLDTDRTELVSVADEPGAGAPIPGHPVSAAQGPTEIFGAVYTPGGKAPIFAPPQPYVQTDQVGASISADGTTVAWMGANVSLQAQMLPGEHPLPSYTEPLWRRIAAGPSAPTRRITGGSDPADPACAASGESVLASSPSVSDPCQGPFVGLQEGRTSGIVGNASDDVIPRLSADGYEVAFLGNAPLAALGGAFAGAEPNSDLYVADMHEPLTRVQALRPLTELAGGDQSDISENGEIEDFDISASGQQVAFSTKRIVFPLGSPAYVSASQASPGMLELFAADLEDDTLTRVTEGFEGGPSEHPHEPKPSSEDPYQLIGDGALSPSFTDNGDTLAFTSTASNLVFGDGNTPPLGTSAFDGADAFVVSRVVFTPTPTPQSISPAPGEPAIRATWRLGLTARSRADGTVALYVVVPGAGTLEAVAQGAVRVRSKRHGHIGTSVATRSVASAVKSSKDGQGELIAVALRASARYRSLANRRPGLAATVTVTFASPHHASLRQSVRVTFLRTEKAKKKKTVAKRGSTSKRSSR